MFRTIWNWLEHRMHSSLARRPRPRSFIIRRTMSSLVLRWRGAFGLNAANVTFSRCGGLIAPGEITELFLGPAPLSGNSPEYDAAGSPQSRIAPVDRPSSSAPHVLSLEGERVIDDVHAVAPFNRKLAGFDPGAFPSWGARFVAWIQWGDGDISLGSLLRDNGRWWVCGSHRYALPGQYLARVTLSDGMSQAITRNVWIQVAQAVEHPLHERSMRCDREALVPRVDRWVKLAGPIGTAG